MGQGFEEGQTGAFGQGGQDGKVGFPVLREKVIIAGWSGIVQGMAPAGEAAHPSEDRLSEVGVDPSDKGDLYGEITGPQGFECVEEEFLVFPRLKNADLQEPQGRGGRRCGGGVEACGLHPEGEAVGLGEIQGVFAGVEPEVRKGVLGDRGNAIEGGEQGEISWMAANALRPGDVRVPDRDQVVDNGGGFSGIPLEPFGKARSFLFAEKLRSDEEAFVGRLVRGFKT